MMRVSGEYDVVVVGGGIMGSCAAYQVAKRGHSVLLLEQFDLLHRRGSSHGETRTIRITYPEPYYTCMMKEAFSLWIEAQLEAGYMVHTPSPQLDFGPKDNASLQAAISSCQLHSIPHEVLSSRETERRFPAFAFPDDHIALVTDQGGVLHASKAVAMFQSLAFKHGVALRDRIKVNKVATGWKHPNGKDGVLITTDQGSVLAEKCIITVGAWTSKFVEEICGLNLPIQPLHTTLAYWQIENSAGDVFSKSKGFPSFASYGKPYIYGNASIELPGLLKVGLHSGCDCDPDNRTLLSDHQALTEVVSPWLKTHLKGNVRADGPVLAEACMYSMTPDQDFIIDFLPTGNKHVVVGAGFSGHGFKMGPLVGRILADLCLKGACEKVPLEYFSISRFSVNPKGNVKSFGEQVQTR